MGGGFNMSKLTEDIRGLVNYYKTTQKLLKVERSLIQLLLWLLNRYEENEKGGK